MRLLKNSLWSRFAAVGLPFFRSEERWRAWLGLGLLVALLLLLNALNVVNSYTTRDFMTALEQRDFTRFYSIAALLAAVFAASTIVCHFTVSDSPAKRSVIVMAPL